MKQELAQVVQLPMSEIMSISTAFAESGMFPDVTKAAQAMVKIMAGQEIGIPPFQSMNGISIIKGKTTLGAGIMASRVKGSGKYDYDVKQLDDKGCILVFKQGNKVLGESEFNLEHAKKAQTQNLEKFPRNMFFARAISNGVKWYAADVFSGPVYVPEEMEGLTEDVPHEIVEPIQIPAIPSLPEIIPGSNEWKNAVKFLRNGKATLEQIKASGILSPENEVLLLQTVEEAA